MLDTEGGGAAGGKGKSRAAWKNSTAIIKNNKIHLVISWYINIRKIFDGRWRHGQFLGGS